MSNIRDRSSSDDDDDFTHETNRKRDEVGAPLREIKYKGKEGGKGGKDRTTSTPRWRSIPGLTNKVNDRTNPFQGVWLWVVSHLCS